MKTIIIDGVEYNLTPKAAFHEGDWVIDKQGFVHQVANVVENVTNHTYGYDIVGGGYFNGNTEGVRLWNISDAKDGDILVFKNNVVGIIICKSPTHYDTRSYCRLSIGGDFINEEESGWDSTQLIPASKEQRDQLEKAMSDAGYIFDFEKKELKEIENEEYDGEDYGIDGLWHAKNILEKTLGNVDGYQSDDGILEHKCAISAVDKLYKHSIAWSEEDKHWMQKAIDFMNHPDLIKATPTLAKDTINWLKSLKGRVQPQSKQEWSEEDESNFQGIIDELKVNKHHAPDCDLPTYDRFLSWFKSLKERYVWKPSDEQMKILSTYANVNDVLASLYQDLKKLKE